MSWITSTIAWWKFACWISGSMKICYTLMAVCGFHVDFLLISFCYYLLLTTVKYWWYLSPGGPPGYPGVRPDNEFMQYKNMELVSLICFKLCDRSTLLEDRLGRFYGKKLHTLFYWITLSNSKKKEKVKFAGTALS